MTGIILYVFSLFVGNSTFKGVKGIQSDTEAVWPYSAIGSLVTPVVASISVTRHPSGGQFLTSWQETWIGVVVVDSHN